MRFLLGGKYSEDDDNDYTYLYKYTKVTELYTLMNCMHVTCMSIKLF